MPYQKGYNARRDGLAAVPPSDLSQAGKQEWLQGWYDANRDIKSGHKNNTVPLEYNG